MTTSPTDTSAGDDGLFDMSGYPFKFNPPPHPDTLHYAPDLSTRNRVEWEGSLNRIYDDKQSTFNNDADTAQFPTLRLGRIIQGKYALTSSMYREGQRYGFRFLYNPTTVSGSTNVGTDFIPDPGSTMAFVLQEGLEVISFELLLNRTPEVIQRSKVGEYQHAITDEEFTELQTRGTNYDLEYLYRVANGSHDLRTRSNTGDIGILLPNPAELYIGGRRSRGALLSMSATTTLFNEQMVPAFTYVQVQFARFLTVSEEGIATLTSGGVLTTAGPLDSGSGGSSASSGPAATQIGNPHEAPSPATKPEQQTWPFGSPAGYYDAGYHTGDDYSAPKGSPILATRGGVIRFAGEGGRPGEGPPYGKHVTILHESEAIVTLYAHMDRILVSKGQSVVAGQQIGTVGNTGTKSSGDHVHYEERFPPYSYDEHRTPIWGNWQGTPHVLNISAP